MIFASDIHDIFCVPPPSGGCFICAWLLAFWFRIRGNFFSYPHIFFLHRRIATHLILCFTEFCLDSMCGACLVPNMRKKQRKTTKTQNCRKKKQKRKKKKNVLLEAGRDGSVVTTCWMWDQQRSSGIDIPGKKSELKKRTRR